MKIELSRHEKCDPNLLALAMSAFLMAAGCGDDEGALVTASDAGEASPTADASTSVMSPGPLDAAASADGSALDTDQDGFSEAAGDCDDFNNLIFPGARETGKDGVDSDCDGSDSPASTLVWALDGEDNTVDALAIMDADADGTISIDEFEAQCAESAMLVGEANPGVLQYHASCAGNNACRGMVYQAWDELFEHSCRAVNACAGWSCVETADDERRDGEKAASEANCWYCHTMSENDSLAFGIPIRPGNDPEEYLEQFWDDMSDDYLRSLIAFGASYIAPNGYAVANMPGSYRVLSRREIDEVIGFIQTLPVSAHPIDLPGAPLWDAGLQDAGENDDPGALGDGGDANVTDFADAARQ
jgi:hypothetical protein